MIVAICFQLPISLARGLGVACASWTGSCCPHEPQTNPGVPIPAAVSSCDSAAGLQVPIDAEAATRLLVARFRVLFRDKYILDPQSGKHARIPELRPAALDRVEKTDTAWSIEAAPPAGWAVKGKVDICGRWVEIETVSYANE